jgi:hypothetical protein
MAEGDEDMGQAEARTVLFDGGPRHGQTDTFDEPAAVVGRGDEGGVYQRTDDERDGLLLYRWQPLTDAEAGALLRGDLRANQQ